MKFLTNNANFRYYTIKFTDHLKFIAKPFTRERNFDRIELPAFFNKPNTLFYFERANYFHFHSDYVKNIRVF